MIETTHNKQSLNYTKHICWAFLGKPFLSKTETGAQIIQEGIPFQVTVTQDYYNKEFKNVDKN